MSQRILHTILVLEVNSSTWQYDTIIHNYCHQRVMCQLSLNYVTNVTSDWWCTRGNTSWIRNEVFHVFAKRDMNIIQNRGIAKYGCSISMSMYRWYSVLIIMKPLLNKWGKIWQVYDDCNISFSRHEKQASIHASKQAYMTASMQVCKCF